MTALVIGAILKNDARLTNLLMKDDQSYWSCPNTYLRSSAPALRRIQESKFLYKELKKLEAKWPVTQKSFQLLIQLPWLQNLVIDPWNRRNPSPSLRPSFLILPTTWTVIRYFIPEMFHSFLSQVLPPGHKPYPLKKCLFGRRTHG